MVDQAVASRGRNKGRTNKLHPYVCHETHGHFRLGKRKTAQNKDTGEMVELIILDKRKILKNQVNDQVQREITSLKLMNHPCLPEFLEIIDRATDVVLVTTEHRGAGLDLKTFVDEQGPFSEELARRIFQQLLLTFHYLQVYEIKHPAIGPRRVTVAPTLEGFKIQLNEVFFSKFDTEEVDFTNTAPSEFQPTAPPEILCGEQDLSDEAANVWMLGSIVYLLLCGTLPFPQEHLMLRVKKMQQNEYDLPSNLSQDIQDLIRSCLAADRSQRPTLLQLRGHPWVKVGLPDALVRLVPEVPNDCGVDRIVLKLVAQALGISCDVALRTLEQTPRRRKNDVTLLYERLSGCANNSLRPPSKLSLQEPMNLSGLHGSFDDELNRTRRPKSMSNPMLRQNISLSPFPPYRLGADMLLGNQYTSISAFAHHDMFQNPSFNQDPAFTQHTTFATRAPERQRSSSCPAISRKPSLATNNAKSQLRTAISCAQMQVQPGEAPSGASTPRGTSSPEKWGFKKWFQNVLGGRSRAKAKDQLDTKATAVSKPTYITSCSSFSSLGSCAESGSGVLSACSSLDQFTSRLCNGSLRS